MKHSALQCRGQSARDFHFYRFIQTHDLSHRVSYYLGAYEHLLDLALSGIEPGGQRLRPPSADMLRDFDTVYEGHGTYDHDVERDHDEAFHPIRLHVCSDVVDEETRAEEQRDFEVVWCHT